MYIVSVFNYTFTHDVKISSLYGESCVVYPPLGGGARPLLSLGQWFEENQMVLLQALYSPFHLRGTCIECVGPQWFYGLPGILWLLVWGV